MLSQISGLSSPHQNTERNSYLMSATIWFSRYSPAVCRPQSPRF